jgi:hypothetical protein|tara:strand:- start:1089 stop:1307 length:219 start_codon:yes stop_codon:yes gene_type:complete
MNYLKIIKELEAKIVRLESQLQQGEEMHTIDEQESYMTHREQCYYDRNDYAQERLERGEICEIQASEIRMGA